VRVRDTQILRRVPASVQQIFDMDDVRFTAENLQLELPVALRLPVHGDIVMDFCPRPLFQREVLGLQLREEPGRSSRTQ
jgi:hypothetical protein